MTEATRELRIKALAERSSYVEAVLKHRFIAELSSAIWKLDPQAALQVFNGEVDNAGFDVMLGLGSEMRLVQLKQSHNEKPPGTCSVRYSFSAMPGSCVVHLSHGIADLAITTYRFLGAAVATEPMGGLDHRKVTKSAGRRDEDGTRILRANYRDVSVKQFLGPFTAEELLMRLFPGFAR